MIKFQVGNVTTTVNFPISERDNVGAILQQFLTAEVPGAKFLWAYKSGQWDGKVRLFEDNVSNFKIMTGMYPAALTAIGSKYHCEFDDYRGIQSPQLTQYTVPLRPYQHEVLSAAFASQAPGAGWWPRGIIHVATGGGKTEIAVAMYQTYPVETIFLVHRKDLLLQAQERFASYGIDAGIIGANQFKPKNGLNIITMQTLASILEANDSRLPTIAKLLFDAKQVFFDEAHIMASSQDKGNEFVKLANNFFNAHARWGLTATPFMRGQYDNLLLEGVTGNILATVPTDWLIQHGYLTSPKVKMIKVPGKLPMKFNFKASQKAKAEYYREAMTKGITVNSWRNQRIAHEATKGPFPCLILVKTIEQINMLKLYLPSIAVLTGSNSAQERRDMVAKLRNGTVPILIATTIFDEGVDIPEIQKVILGSGGKSQVKLLQRAGRGLRLAANKHEVILIDFIDSHSSILENHSKARKAIWTNEGFEVEEIQ